MSGDYEWRKSLRKNADTGRSKSAKPRKQQTKQRSQVNRIQSASQTRPQRHTEMENRTLYSVPPEEKAICVNCQRHLENLYEQYETRCNCDRKVHFMCRECIFWKTTTYQCFVPRCGRRVYTSSFSLSTSSSTPSNPQPNKPRGQDFSLGRSPQHPKCDSCNKEAMLKYILPCDHKLCEHCFHKDRVVKMTENEHMIDTKQTFLCGKKDGETECCYAIQRVHMISQGYYRNEEGLVCVSCESGIQLNEACLLMCNHCACNTCYHNSSARGLDCPMCCEKSGLSRFIEMMGGKFPDVLTSLRKFDVGKESLSRIVEGRDALICMDHKLKGFVQLHCDRQLCVVCIEEMVAEKNIVMFKMDDIPVPEKHCICSCRKWNERHILSLKCLQTVVSQSVCLYQCYDCCSQKTCPSNYEMGCLKLRDCGHTFCRTCLHARLGENDSIITSNMENIREGQKVMICGTISGRNRTKSCKVEIPWDEVRGFTDKDADDKHLTRGSQTHGGKPYIPKKPASADVSQNEELGLPDKKADDYFKIDDGGSCGCGYCSKKSFIKLGKCGHRWCKECMVKKYQEGGPYCDKIHEMREYIVCGITSCTKEIPAYQLKQYCSVMVKDTFTAKVSLKNENMDILRKQSVPPADTSGTVAKEGTLAKDDRKVKDEERGDSPMDVTGTVVNQNVTGTTHTSTAMGFSTTTNTSDATQTGGVTRSHSGQNDVCSTEDKTQRHKNYLRDVHHGSCSKLTCRKGFVLFCDCSHRLCRECLQDRIKIMKDHNEDRMVCGIGLRQCTSEIPINELTNFLEERPVKKNYVRDVKYHWCNTSTCRRKSAFIEFCDCSHRLCRECLQNRIKDRTVTRDDNQDTMVCGISGCTKEIPHNQLKKFLEERTRHYCDYRDCKSETEEDKMNIRHIFSPCGHRLCIICTSIKIEYKKNINCIVEGCTSSASGMGQYGTSDFPERQEIMGIPNVGLTCYASCILQVLGQTPNFREDLKTYSQHSEESHVDKVLDRLLTGVNDTANGVYTINWGSMDNLMRRIFRIDSSFRRYEENDCHSFIMTLLNALKKEDTDKKTEEGTGNSFLDDSNTDAKSPGKEESKDGRRPTNIEKSPGRQDNTKTESGQCPAVLFESLLTSTFTYTPCTHEECIDPQVFFSLLIPVQEGEWTVEKGLGQFLKVEEFTDNELPCRTCNYSMPKTITTRSLQITKAPKILMLQLARFKQEDSVGFYKTLRKTEDPVKFDMTLTIDKKYSSEKEDLTYELYGIVMHRGNMQGGHYTSLVKRQNTHRWYYCSDSCVREVPKRDILHHHVYKHAYVLFYSKQ